MKLVRGMGRVFTSNWKLTTGLVLLLLLILTAVTSPLIASAVGGGQDPVAIAAYEKWQVPSPDHWLGTDQFGRDVFAMVIGALAVSLKVGAIAGVISTIAGVLMAFIAGYKGGAVDGVLSTFTDMVLVVPSFPLLIALSAYTKNVGITQVALMLAVFSWPFAARTIRAHVLSLRARPYVELAKVTKFRDLEIIAYELLPNMLPYIGVGFASSALGAIFALVGLEVIGLGPGETIDLGKIIFSAIGTGALTLGAWPMFVAPILLLTLLFAALNLCNIGLEEVYNPRLRGVAGA
ncbi:peptide/nickel transport system permease protein [Actinopolymorpha cephalotaxi]|uniref:Peptide/nickel transport system permease protein n=1 Tax=Actinopolymorpha cephalotaxi TaxID=504797 RepID=A0A1I2MV64_9ACTN|nr:ABC transporter permease [Actinopolymorpha cephalotaxi]NYH85854.1 peptide/nickel transport system permease protein [Actinopolymorpha cephalotaxi]SFF94549.1 peptide/nickel transport system permease protein [Actinopolymorpha cephalotaxi]